MLNGALRGMATIFLLYPLVLPCGDYLRDKNGEIIKFPRAKFRLRDTP